MAGAEMKVEQDAKKASKWQVVRQGSLHVREKKSVHSKSLGTKNECSKVKGRQDGDWLELEDEPGYIMIEVYDEPALKEVPFGSGNAGHCGTKGGSDEFDDELSTDDLFNDDGDDDMFADAGEDAGKDEDSAEDESNEDYSDAEPKGECAGSGENCVKAMCCKEAGKRCYEKMHGYGTCRATCHAGPDPRDSDWKPWTCKRFGKRAAGQLAKKAWEAPAAKWVKERCSKPGYDCSKTRCCAWPGMQCYKKSKKYANCKVSSPQVRTSPTRIRVIGAARPSVHAHRA